MNITKLSRAEIIYLQDIATLINDGMLDIAVMLAERFARPGKWQQRRMAALTILVSML